MKPIVSPWFFYWIDTINGIKTIILAIAVVAIFATIVLGVFAANPDKSFGEEEEKYFKKCFKIAIITMFTAGLIAILIPSKNTLISMAVAKNITPNNIVIAKDSTKEAIDYIFEKIEKSKTN